MEEFLSGVYLWEDEEEPAFADLDVTTTFNDVAVDDRTTGEVSTTTVSGPGGSCPVPSLEGETWLTGVFNPGALYDFTLNRFSLKGWIGSGFGTACNANPGDDYPFYRTIEWYLEKSEAAAPSSGDWIEVASGSYDADNAFRLVPHSEEFTARYVRLRLRTLFAQPYVVTGDWSANATLTDWRLSGTLSPDNPPTPTPDPTPTPGEPEGDNGWTITPLPTTPPWEEVCGAGESGWSRSNIR